MTVYNKFVIKILYVKCGFRVKGLFLQPSEKSSFLGQVLPESAGHELTVELGIEAFSNRNGPEITLPALLEYLFVFGLHLLR